MKWEYSPEHSSFADRILGRDFGVNCGGATIANSERRHRKRLDQPLIYQVITYIPFSIFDWVLSELEYNFAPSCPWCGRQYFSSSGEKRCHAEIKKERGRHPGAWSLGGVSAGSSIEYDVYSDRCIDKATGKAYSPDRD